MLADHVGQQRNRRELFDAIAQIVPKRDPQLAAGLLQAGEAVAAVFAEIAAGAAADFSPFHEAADVPFAAVGVQN